MDYSYEVDLANGKTVKVTHGEKTSPFLMLADGKSVGGEPQGAYSAEEWIKKAKKKPTFLDSSGNAYASDSIVSARLIT
jgi:hypothetical protein